MESTSITLFGLNVMEPVGALTDYLIGVLCFIICRLLYARSKNSRTIKLWSLFFLIMGLSTWFGGTVHGFRSYMSDSIYTALWLIMQILICTSVYFAERGTIESEFKGSILYKKICLIQLFTFLILVVTVRNFKVASIATAFGLIPPMLAYYKKSTTGQDKRLITIGIFISFLTAVVFYFKISFHRWFNYKDLSHIIIMISLWVMYKGVKSLNGEQTLLLHKN